MRSWKTFFDRSIRSKTFFVVLLATEGICLWCVPDYVRSLNEAECRAKFCEAMASVQAQWRRLERQVPSGLENVESFWEYMGNLPVCRCRACKTEWLRAVGFLLLCGVMLYVCWSIYRLPREDLGEEVS